MMERRRLQALRAERGASLVEVVVAAAVLLVVAAAVTQLVSAATRDSGQSRVHAIAADLAQSQLEELRSKKFEQLLALTGAPQTIAAGGVSFTVRNESSWAMENPPGAAGCGAASRSPEALRVTSTVTWPNMSRRPVVIDTLVAAPAGARAHHGSYVVQVVDRNGLGIQGLTIAMGGGPSPMSGATDVNGCVRFSDLREGGYTLSFSRPGHITRERVNAVSAPVSVVAGQVGSSAFEYDLAGFASVRFLAGETSLPVRVPGVVFKAASTAVAGTLDAATGTIGSSPELWPSTSQYEVHADTCGDGSPVGQVAAQQSSTPPPVDVRVPLARADVRLHLENDDASGMTARFVTRCGSATAGVAGTLSGIGANGHWTSDAVALAPGTLQSVCVTWPAAGGWSRLRLTNLTLAPGDLAGRTFDLGSFGSAQFVPNGSDPCA